MCGIAGIIYRNHGGVHSVGHDMTAMLQSMKHRGPDSTGYALYGPPQQRVIMRYTLADANDPRDFDFEQRLERRKGEVETRLRLLGATIHDVEKETGYAYRVQSECDSEVIAVYLAEKMSDGYSLEDAMRESLEELDGVFTYICVTGDALGVAKDEMAAKPLVLYEADDIVALASEEIAIRAIVDHEIETWDPYEGEVMVWTR